jgi:hypothetical protein
MNRSQKDHFRHITAPQLLFALMLLLGVTGTVIFYFNQDTAVPPSWASAAGPRADLVNWFNILQSGLLVPLLSGIFGTLILRRRIVPGIGWLFLIVGLLSGGQSFLMEYAIHGTYTRTMPPPGTAIAAWTANFIWIFLYAAQMHLLAIFPNGRFLSPRWKTIIQIPLAVFVLALFSASLLNAPLSSAYQIPNPYLQTQPVAAYNTLFLIGVPAMPVAIFLVAGSVLLRFRRSQGRERQQMKWLLVGVLFLSLLTGIGMILNLGLDYPIGGIMVNASLLAPLIGIGVALLRHQLYDIDIIIRRTLLYTAVSATLALIYFGSVLILQAIFSSVIAARSPVFIVISTLVSAALFNPLRSRLQMVIDRRFFRQKYDAQFVLAQFAQRTRDEVALETLTAEMIQVVQQTVQPDHVSLWLKKDARILQ